MPKVVLAWCLFALLFVSPLSVKAAVVALFNATDRDLSINIEHKAEKPQDMKLLAGEVRAVPVGRTAVLRMTLNGKPVAYTLDPYTPYLFVEEKPGAITFSGVELAGELPPPDDVPAGSVASKPLKIPVTLYADDASPFTREAWEKQIRTRFAEASAVVEKQTGVTFEVIGVSDWASSKESADLTAALSDFSSKVEVKRSAKAIGFTNRAVPGDAFGGGGDPGCTHLLLREGKPKAEAERVEVLVHHLGLMLGAVRSPDRGSVMRAKLGDGQATRATFRMQFDPLNLLIVNVWAEELAAGKGPKIADLRPKARARLFALYKTVAGLHSALKTDDTQAREIAEAIDLVRDRDAEKGEQPKPIAPEVEPVVPVLKGAPTAEQLAVRVVVRAVTSKAKELKDMRPKGDELTAAYVQAAATAAVGLDEKVRVRAFLVGLGLALDDSTVLRGKPVLKPMCEAAESDAERKERIAVLGLPTIQGRRDLCQHFAVSATLAELLGPAAAEFAGLSKEMMDMKGASGFSFADLAADLAGIEFAAAVTREPKLIATIARGFALADYVASVKPFREGLSEAKFKADYGTTTDDRFKTALEEVRTAVKALPVYKK